MNLTDEQLDALAERLKTAWLMKGDPWLAVAREAARWAAEQQGEVVWEFRTNRQGWTECTPAEAIEAEKMRWPVRAIRVIATTTKEPSHA